MKELELTLTVRNNLLRERRVSLGLSQKQLAKKVRISSLPTYSHLETLRSLPFRIKPVCRVLNCHKKISPRRPICPEHVEEYGSDPAGWPVEQWPFKRTWKKSALRLAAFYRCKPEELFPESVLAVKTPKATVKANAHAVRSVIESMRSELLPPSATVAMLPPDDIFEQRELRSKIDAVLATLTAREEKIARMRFGLDDTTAMTHAEIADVEEVSIARVGQIERQVLRKLRHPSRSNHLRTFFSPDDSPPCSSGTIRHPGPFQCNLGLPACLRHMDDRSCGCVLHKDKEAKEEEAMLERGYATRLAAEIRWRQTLNAETTLDASTEARILRIVDPNNK